MQLVITLADPKFKPGSFVRVTDGAFDYVAHVLSFYARGTCSYSNGEAWAAFDETCYVLVNQRGHDAIGNAFRPGQVLTVSAEELERTGTHVSFIGPAVGPDTADNIHKRLAKERAA